MIVAMDIGNTNIKAAVFEGSRLVKRWRCATDPVMTSDQYGIIMADLFRYHNLNMQAVEGIMISSVVPTINYTIEHMCRDYFHLEPRLLVPGMKTGLNIALDNPATMGSDLVVGAAAALAIHDPPLIIIDMGTATTMTVIDREARVLGGAIIPGVGISLEALANGTSQLPHISLDAPKKCISTDTVEAMRSGSVYGTAAMLDGMIERMEAELGEPAAVIATGGLGGCIIPYCRREITYDKNLLLNGLWALYQKNKRKR